MVEPLATGSLIATWVPLKLLQPLMKTRGRPVVVVVVVVSVVVVVVV